MQGGSESDMKNIRMIALDLDGTLLNDENNISDRSRGILGRYAHAGVHIVLSTGRMEQSVVGYEDIMGIDCALILYNGAMVKVKRAEGRRTVLHIPLEEAYGDFMIDYSLRHGFLLNYYLNETLYADGNPELRKCAEFYTAQTGARYNFTRDMRSLKGQTPTKLILMTDPDDDANQLRSQSSQFKYFSGFFGNKVNLFRTGPVYLEFLNRHADKGVGLRILAERYGIRKDEILAFGDRENDISMFQYSGAGVAMKNADPHVRSSASAITEFTNNEDGVARYLERHL